MALASRTLAFCVLCALSSVSHGKRTSKETSRADITLSAVPEASEKALTNWYRKKSRFVILESPALNVRRIGALSENYADFKEALTSCGGVCMGGYNFEWRVPRGGGSVQTDEPALFAWAPDDRPDGIAMMAYMRMKMAMPQDIKAVKNALNGYNGAFIQANSLPILDPDWVIPKLKGGRMGTRIGALNADGKALLEHMRAEIAAGPTTEGGGSEPVEPEDPDSKPMPVPTDPRPSPRPSPQPQPARPSAPGISTAEMEKLVDARVKQAIAAQMPDIMRQAREAAEAAVQGNTDSRIQKVAKDAVKVAVADAFAASAESLRER